MDPSVDYMAAPPPLSLPLPPPPQHPPYASLIPPNPPFCKPLRYIAFECCLVAPGPPPPSAPVVDPASITPPRPPSSEGQRPAQGPGARPGSPPPLLPAPPLLPPPSPTPAPVFLLPGGARVPRVGSAPTSSLVRALGRVAAWRGGGVGVDPGAVAAGLDGVCAEANGAVADLVRVGEERAAIGHFCPALDEGTRGG